MSMNVNDHYLAGRVLSASPLELVRILYGGAIEKVREARRHLATGDIGARSREISSALEMIVELSGALDRERGGEVARNLVELYDYIERRLLEANLRQEDAPLAEVLGLLMTLQEAWDELQLRASVPEPPSEVADFAMPPVASGYGVVESGYGCASQSWSA